MKNKIAKTKEDFRLGIMKGKTVFPFGYPGKKNMTMNTPVGKVPFPLEVYGLTNNKLTDYKIVEPGQDFEVDGDTVIEKPIKMNSKYQKGGAMNRPSFNTEEDSMEPTSVQTNTNDLTTDENGNEMSFSQAFAFAKENKMPTFTWNGDEYETGIKAEEPAAEPTEINEDQIEMPEEVDTGDEQLTEQETMRKGGKFRTDMYGKNWPVGDELSGNTKPYKYFDNKRHYGTRGNKPMTGNKFLDKAMMYGKKGTYLPKAQESKDLDVDNKYDFNTMSLDDLININRDDLYRMSKEQKSSYYKTLRQKEAEMKQQTQDLQDVEGLVGNFIDSEQLPPSPRQFYNESIEAPNTKRGVKGRGNRNIPNYTDPNRYAKGGMMYAQTGMSLDARRARRKQERLDKYNAEKEASAQQRQLQQDKDFIFDIANNLSAAEEMPKPLPKYNNQLPGKRFITQPDRRKDLGIQPSWVRQDGGMMYAQGGEDMSLEARRARRRQEKLDKYNAEQEALKQQKQLMDDENFIFDIGQRLSTAKQMPTPLPQYNNQLPGKRFITQPERRKDLGVQPSWVRQSGGYVDNVYPTLMEEAKSLVKMGRDYNYDYGMREIGGYGNGGNMYQKGGKLTGPERRYDKYLSKNNIPYWAADYLLRSTPAGTNAPAILNEKGYVDHFVDDFAVKDPTPNNFYNIDNVSGPTSRHYSGLPEDEIDPDFFIQKDLEAGNINYIPNKKNPRRVYNFAEPGNQYYDNAVSVLKKRKKQDKRASRKKGGMMYAQEGIDFRKAMITPGSRNANRPQLNYNPETPLMLQPEYNDSYSPIFNWKKGYERFLDPTLGALHGVNPQNIKSMVNDTKDFIDNYGVSLDAVDMDHDRYSQRMDEYAGQQAAQREIERYQRAYNNWKQGKGKKRKYRKNGGSMKKYKRGDIIQYKKGGRIMTGVIDGYTKDGRIKLK